MTQPPLFHCSWSKTTGVPLLLHLCFEISHGKPQLAIPVLQTQSFGLQIIAETVSNKTWTGLSPSTSVSHTSWCGVSHRFSSFSHWLQTKKERCLDFMFINPHHSSSCVWCIYCLSANWGQVIYFMKQPERQRVTSMGHTQPSCWGAVPVNKLVYGL